MLDVLRAAGAAISIDDEEGTAIARDGETTVYRATRKSPTVWIAIATDGLTIKWGDIKPGG
jgi:hypothetical protein